MEDEDDEGTAGVEDGEQVGRGGGGSVQEEQAERPRGPGGRRQQQRRSDAVPGARQPRLVLALHDGRGVLGAAEAARGQRQQDQVGGQQRRGRRREAQHEPVVGA